MGFFFVALIQAGVGYFIAPSLIIDAVLFAITLNTMRELLFRQGNGEIKLNGKTIEIKFKNRFSYEKTKNLKKWFEKVNPKKEGLELLGGLKIKFRLKYPNGEEFKNKLKKVPLFLTEKN